MVFLVPSLGVGIGGRWERELGQGILGMLVDIENLYGVILFLPVCNWGIVLCTDFKDLVINPNFIVILYRQNVSLSDWRGLKFHPYMRKQHSFKRSYRRCSGSV